MANGFDLGQYVANEATCTNITPSVGETVTFKANHLYVIKGNTNKDCIFKIIYKDDGTNYQVIGNAQAGEFVCGFSPFFEIDSSKIEAKSIDPLEADPTYQINRYYEVNELMDNSEAILKKLLVHCGINGIKKVYPLINRSLVNLNLNNSYEIEGFQISSLGIMNIDDDGTAIPFIIDYQGD